MKIKNLLSILFLSSLMVYSGAADMASDYSKLFTSGEATVKIEKDTNNTDTTKLVFNIHVTVTEAKKNFLPASFNTLADSTAITAADFTSLKTAFSTAVAKTGSNAKKAYDDAKTANAGIGDYSESNIKSAKKAGALKIAMVYEVAVASTTTTKVDESKTPVADISKFFTVAPTIAFYSTGTEIAAGGTGQVKISLVHTADNATKYIPATLGETEIAALKKAITTEMGKTTGSTFKTKFDEYIDTTATADSYAETKITKVEKINPTTIHVTYGPAKAKKAIPAAPSA